MVVPPRLELGQTVSETGVLPLHHGTAARGFLLGTLLFGEFILNKN
tara:strand:+ start:2230 stop:2367 length:138 start_codon:yes stop_codon:yes gene_type:complete